MSSFYVALGALNASSTAVSAVGNNLANMNTTGYKATTVSFLDMMSQQIGGGGSTSQMGMGVMSPIVQHVFTQGTVQTSTGQYDAAIEGGGFFVVRDNAGETHYTRAGNFSLDGSGNLVAANGDYVQGWNAVSGKLDTSGGVTNVTVPAGTLHIPIATSKFSMTANLNASAAVGDKFSTPIEIIDSLGQSHTMTVTFTNTAPNNWDYDITIPGEEISGGKAGTPSSIGSGKVVFDSSGTMTTPDAKSSPIALNKVTFVDGAADQTMNWNMYNADGTQMISQWVQPSATSATTQDGEKSAQPIKLALGNDGVIIAKYSNGKTVNVAQIALASIRNPESLTPIGNNEYDVSIQTEAPTIGTSGTGGRGNIIGGSLESSTVDIAKEFTDLMVYQRSYQANSKVISTLDELSQAVINIKR